ncbi:MAG: apolipoprotein N-acyltransferase, partial [Bacteroidetes bacterium]|nr:apolipoprotein N-acyltransferase [Bacteroidota bacterium]
IDYAAIGTDGRIEPRRLADATVHRDAGQPTKLFKATPSEPQLLSWAATGNTYFTCTIAPVGPDNSSAASYIAEVKAYDLDADPLTTDDATLTFVTTAIEVKPESKLTYIAAIHLGEKDATSFRAEADYSTRNYYFQISESFGMCTFTWLVELMVWLLNSLFFTYFVVKRRKLRFRTAVAFVAVLLLSFGFGIWRRAQVTQTAKYVTVGLVQPAMDAHAWTERLGASRLSHLMTLSDSLITSMNAPPIFMIWPEMAIPAPASTSRQQFVDDQLQAWTEQQEIALLTGALVPESTQPDSSRFYNRAFLYRPYAERQHYNQVHLLPYGPQVPLAEQSPWLPPRDTRFVRGKSQQPLLFDDIRIGVLLGFEVLLGDYARQYPLKNVDFLVALTLDGWWGNTPGYRQHLSYLRLRSIETRRSIVHVASSGSTALLAPDGSVIYRADAHQPTARLAAVPVYDGITLYARYGNWLGYAALVLSLALTGWTFILLSWRYWQGLDGSPEYVEALPG